MFRRVIKLSSPQRNKDAAVMKVTKLAVPSIMSQFRTVEVSFSDGDEIKKAISFIDDIYMLFNQQRLMSAGKDTIQAWLNTLESRSDSLAELRKKCSDEQLMQFCKSRYIQSPSELLAWSDYLNANYDSEVARIQAEQAKETAVETLQSPASEKESE